MLARFLSALLVAVLAPGTPVHAEEEVPYWASIQVSRANMRSGPGENYAIEWIYQRDGLPVKVVRRLSGWRLVEDPDGARGWIVSRFLSLERTVIVTGDALAPMRAKGSETAPLLWRLEPGVVGNLGECGGGWCAISIGERAGYVAANRIWGEGEP
ncbi:SH3 domain-containing protein [Croceicoccus hydrothermalis]|uniref:SH3 domain-containing protein n=1 Tax=Croceicoccus hydrothermalis TaxID=2867964 RepID=UPI001EFAAFC5|nr:SH3 domain-containing protein [Croceicoccus hydrothermalis]